MSGTRSERLHATRAPGDPIGGHRVPGERVRSDDVRVRGERDGGERLRGGRDGGERPRVRVLIVDDEPALTELLSVAVTEAGWRPYPVADGHSALRAARGCAPHAVVLDGMLPDLDGIQVLRRLRYENPRLPVLMLTARDALEHRIDGLSSGADDYVTKPFSLEEVVLRLRGLLRRAGAEPLGPTTPSWCSVISS